MWAGKFDICAEEGILLGYFKGDAHHVMSSSGTNIVESKDVRIFDNGGRLARGWKTLLSLSNHELILDEIEYRENNISFCSPTWVWWWWFGSHWLWRRRRWWWRLCVWWGRLFTAGSESLSEWWETWYGNLLSWFQRSERATAGEPITILGMITFFWSYCHEVRTRTYISHTGRLQADQSLLRWNVRRI